MKIEKVKSEWADSWMHVRRINHGEARQYTEDIAGKSSAWADTFFAALCLCNEDGRSPYASKEDSLKAVDGFDWKLVQEIAKQATEFNESAKTVKDAEKNS